jgi:hypothetical protein
MSSTHDSAPLELTRLAFASPTAVHRGTARRVTPSYVAVSHDPALPSERAYDWREVQQCYQRRAAYIFWNNFDLGGALSPVPERTCLPRP